MPQGVIVYFTEVKKNKDILAGSILFTEGSHFSRITLYSSNNFDRVNPQPCINIWRDTDTSVFTFF
jgi:hypothetical protein